MLSRDDVDLICVVFMTIDMLIAVIATHSLFNELRGTR